MAKISKDSSDVPPEQFRCEKRDMRLNHQQILGSRLLRIKCFTLLPEGRRLNVKSKIMPSVISVATIFMLLTFCSTVAEAKINFGYFNKSSATIPNSVWDILQTKQVTFRTCTDSGNLLNMRESQSSSTSLLSSSSSSSFQELKLYLHNTSAYFSWSTATETDSVHIESTVNDNRWYTVWIKHLLGVLSLQLQADRTSPVMSVVVANSTYHPSLLDVRLSGPLVVGQDFSGCIYQGPGVNLNARGLISQNVMWDTCPLSARVGCGDVDDCWKNPCQNGATCVDLANSYKCDCPPNFNGTDCQNDLARMYGCTVQPCQNEGTCITRTTTTADSRQYRCQCRDGYAGVNCESRLDMCRTRPCQTGTCTSGENSYTCDCQGTGFKGVNCTEDVDECENTTICGSYPCSNYPGIFSCDCPSGYDGIPCKEINECDSSPCLNNGQCIDGSNSYSCNCLLGFNGSRCNINIDECADNPCREEHNRCVDGVNSYTCECLAGFTGTPSSCVDIKECDQNVCRNGAACTELPGSYQCDCVLGYNGTNCEIDIDECESVQCLNNASCSEQINNYTCNCLPGFRGRLCEEDINDCEGHLCRNGANCKDLIEDYECECVAGWEGQFCEVDTNDCLSNPCFHGGTCRDRLNGFNCTCAPGYRGLSCNIDIDECISDPCMHGGECFNGIADYTCNCTSDWMGKNCSEVYNDCLFKPFCLHGGNCSTSPPSHNKTCDCVKGFWGKYCENNIDDCEVNTCQSFQECKDGIGSYTCGCPTGFAGDRCQEEIDECQNKPCQNGGTCTDGSGEYTCTCEQRYINITKSIGPKGVFLTGYTGPNCENDIDECQYSDPPICQNEAKCEDSPAGSFTCYCKSESDGKLSAGKLCEALKTYCDIASEPCYNGGTCISQSYGSACRCAPGYSGLFCETDIDECEINPCQNNGSCTDLVNDYACSCIEGITGRNCEQNIDDCEPEPCKNGGICDDRINGFSCNCTDTGFTGDQCQIEIDDCIDHKCQHGSTCRDGVKMYTCDCLPAYEGTYCEIDVPECAATPCQYNSTCLEYSNQDLYGHGDPRFETFSFEGAVGYTCECVDGVKGINCSVEINECLPDPCKNGAQCEDRFNDYFCSCTPGYEGPTCANETNECTTLDPCKNGGTCKDLLADYICTCPPVTSSGSNYGGKNCTTYLSGCDRSNPCIHGTCFPKLESETPIEHSYRCMCNRGYTGNNCNKATVFSFTGGTYISQAVQDLQFDLSLRFRTTLSNSMIFLCKFSHDRYVAVVLEAGKVYVKYQYGNVGNIQSFKWSLNTKNPLNDAVFHSLKVILTHNITVILPDETCPDQGDKCQIMERYSRTPDGDAVLFIGSIREAGLSDTTDLTENYTGCMDDIFFNDNYFIPGEPYGEIIGLKGLGCTRTEQCLPNSCYGHGRCEDLWDAFRCHCERPFYGQFCSKDFTPMTFGQNPDTLASYEVPPGTNDKATISFFVTTRQENGFIMYAGNKKFNNIGQLTFFSFKLCNGLLCFDFVKCNQALQNNTNVFIADGEKHMVEISVMPTSLKVSVDFKKVYSSDIQPSEDVCNFGFKFFISVIYLGQVPSTLVRRRRSAADVGYSRQRRNTDSAPDGLSMFSTSSNLDPFEGVLQDVRVDSFKFGIPNDNNVISPNPDSNFTIGAESTKQVCNSEPCMNDGNCTDIFFNDFRCDCKRGYRGKNCSEPDFCSFGSCPDGSNCFNLQDGYECIGAAQFSGSSFLTYKLSGISPDSVVTVEFRTRILFGVIFFIGKDDYYFKLRIANGQLEISHKLTPDFSETVRTLDGRLVNDGRWYQAQLTVTNSTELKFQIYYDGKLFDESATVTVDTTSTDFETMLNSSGYLTLGATWNVDEEANFIGCLNQTRIGGVLLPFFRDNLFENNTAPVKFVVDDVQDLRIGCQSPDECETAPSCLNGGTCKDTWFAHRCDCPLDFEGRRCESKKTDYCQMSPCRNQGNCIDGIGKHTCDCPTGFIGENCENDLDFCTNATSLCQNGATCVEETNGPACNCSQDYTGLYCNESLRQTCQDSPCQNGAQCMNVNITIGGDEVPSFNCTCLEPYGGPLCEKRTKYCDKQPPPCQNGGMCSESVSDPYYTCNCTTTDFTGPQCAERIDDCISVNCNNGSCTDSNSSYVCSCNEGNSGLHCESEIQCDTGCCQRGNRVNNVCDCTGTGYEGEHCDQDINECNRSVCVHAISCENTEGNFSCNCSRGFRGNKCDEPFCDTGLCLNDATCRVNDTNWICDCPKFYGGERCELKGLCADNPCNASNTQLCSQTLKPQMTYKCDCESGWTGQNCSTNIDECTEGTHDCVNGTCIDMPGTFTCQCTPGFTGAKCDQDINECEPNPCMNKATCTDRINQYICNCSGTGYEGVNCTDDVDECTEDRVCNHGNCTNNVGSFTCECGKDYLGSKCEQLNLCINQTCSRDEICNYTLSVSGSYSFSCKCIKGPDEKCKADRSTGDDDSDLAIIIGPIVGGIIFIILLVLIIAFVMSARSKRATRGAYSPSQQETSGSRVELGNVLKKPPEERLI